MTTQLVDWATAVSVGSRLAGDGPQVKSGEAAAIVAELRAGAERSTGLVRDFTGLEAQVDTAPILVVDRPGWVQANADAFATIIDPIAAKLAHKKGPPNAVSRAVGAKVTGGEIGLMLGFLGSKVLGQFDPFHEPSGRLLLVAPNIVEIEREIEADPTDFRLWVCLHEETHRVQFTAVPWMREHLFAQVEALVETVDADGVPDDVLARIGEALKGGNRNLLELFGGPERAEIMDRVTGLMSLLEGHADVVMDGVGPSVIPSVNSIRKSFTKRRQGVGVLDKFLRRMLGLDAKMAQYRDGAAFVRAVVDQVGMEQFNAVWAAPENLPGKAEIHDPAAWVTRVLG